MTMMLVRFRLSTLLLLTAFIAAGLATQNRRSAWYISKSIPSGVEHNFELAAFEDQDLLACLKTTGPESLVVRRLSTGEVLHDFEFDGNSKIECLQAGQDGKLYGFGAYRVIRIDLQTSESTELMTGSDGPPESLLVKGVSPDGRFVLLAVQDVVELPNGRSIIRPSTPVTYRICNLATGELQWELKTTDTRDSAGAFLSDGKRIAIPIDNHLQIWDYGKNIRSDESQSLIFPPRDLLLFPDGRRFVTTHSIRDLHSGVDLERLDIGFECAIVNDSFFINTSNGQLNYWRRRRVEGSWSPLSFPEAWVTGAFAIALMFNVVGYWRRQRSHAEHVASR